MAAWLLPAQTSDLRQRLVLLTGQAFFFGITLAMLIVSGSAIFLSALGAARLPFVYITVALLGALLSYRLAALLQRWSLPTLAINSTGGLALLLLIAWAGIRFTGLQWLAFVLLVVFSLYLQIGFVFIGGQAGRLFDVRQIKSLFPRVVAGFAVGFMIGGFLAGPLLALSSQPADLLLTGVVSTLLTLLLLLLTNQRFTAELALHRGSQRRQPVAPLGQLLRKPFVLLIFLYQMLSAIGTQLIDFMVYERAAARYTDSAELARFIGNFTALLNLVDILFLALLAGFLVSRYGLNFGLTANPAGVGILLVGVALAGFWLGPASLLFFIFIGAARIADISLTDGTTRTATNAAYQALPPAERLAVQTGVEGIGVPLALGLTGVILLIFQAIPALTIFHLALLTLFITILWTAAGFWVYRGYATSLLTVLRTGALQENAPIDLNLDDPAARAVVARLVAGDKPHEVRLGLDLLQQAAHPVLTQNLLALVASPHPTIQVEALQRIEQLRIKAALPAVEKALATAPDEATKAVALRTLAAVAEADALPTLAPYLDHPDAALRSAALVGLLRNGGIPGILAAGERLLALQQAAAPVERQLAAQIIGAVGVQQFYQPLQPLLQDEAITVRQAAIQAAGQVRHPDLLPLLLLNVDNPTTRAATMLALQQYGETLLPLVEQALMGQVALSPEQVARLVQISGRTRSDKAAQLLWQQLDHPDRTVGYAILAALQTLGYRPTGNATPQLLARCRREATHGLRILRCQDALGTEAAFAHLQRALDDELGLVQRSLFRLLALRYEAQAITRAEQQIRTGPEGAQALALEMLDVTLSSEEKALALPLLHPQLSAAQRLQQLTNQVTVSPQPRDQWVTELIADPNQIWSQPWLSVCAIYGAGQVGLHACTPAITARKDSHDPILQETVAWALTRLQSVIRN
jgi:HEAT repeat protein